MLSVFLTLIFSIPSIIILLNKPKYKYMKLALFNISMSFFFFSYHVHEKTILIPMIPLLLCIRYFNLYYIDFISMSCITLYPLLREDQQTINLFALGFCNLSYTKYENLYIFFLKSLSLLYYNMLEIYGGSWNCKKQFITK